jgi:hypothetical protein
VPSAAPSLALSLLTVPSLLLAVQMLAPSKATPYGWLFLLLPTAKVVGTRLA